jgi:hypothetical protein
LLQMRVGYSGTPTHAWVCPDGRGGGEVHLEKEVGGVANGVVVVWAWYQHPYSPGRYLMTASALARVCPRRGGTPLAGPGVITV